MRKFLPYILILTILVQLLAPFSLGSGTKINKAGAVAGSFYYWLYVKDSPQQKVGDFASLELCNTTRTDFINSDAFKIGYKTDGSGVYTSLPSDCLEEKEEQTMIDVYLYEVKNKTGEIIFTSEGFEDDKNRGAKEKCDKSRDNYIDELGQNLDGLTVGQCTAMSVQQNLETTIDNYKKNNTNQLPACSLNPFWGEGTVVGCVAQVFYYVLFVPTSYVFALAGTFFDFTFHYSVQDESYRTPFVVEGWGIVRDFCNMFFIFVLLYIAFGTILKLHSVKTKEMIINVIIIGLLINFSLFATQVIIDASNILARVFYNSDSIKITQNSTAGTAGLKIGPNGEIPLSAAIVNKVNPQNLIINGTKAVKIQDKVTNETSTAEDTEGTLGVGAFILITLLATAVNIVGIIVFLSVGLIFVTRVIGLWFAMIFSPFVFFSYTVPSLQDMEMVGWKKWWPETLKLAFLAPMFIFFMYLIIAFLEKGLSLVKANDVNNGMTFVISVIVPFIFIMVLLMKAKDIAKDMSGKMGQSITNGIAAAGGIALGGAAIGTAMFGRRVIGQTMAKASRGDTATQKFEAAKGNAQAMSKLTAWEKTKGAIGSYGTLGLLGKAYGKVDPVTGKVNEKSIGGLLNKKQKTVGDVDHARHEMDEIKKTAGLEGVDDKKLSGEDEEKIKKTYNKTKRSEIETMVKRGENNKGEDILIQDPAHPNDPTKRYKGEEAYKAARRNEVIADVHATAEPGDLDGLELSDAGKKKVENKLNAEFNIALKDTTETELKKTFEHIREESRQSIGMLTRGISRANKASYDVRKLSDIKSDKREGVFTKVPVALIAGIATGVRAGIKNVGLSNGGVKVEGNFMKDLGNTISDSLKNMKVNVDLSHVGETKSSADSHGGGGHH